ncbi:hypothetical protein HYU94_02640 [Candidatus Daviesbacteria bacterium]|nr:hypothetical protein [Candidatus Daviesbacteria bacterium]
MVEKKVPLWAIAVTLSLVLVFGVVWGMVILSLTKVNLQTSSPGQAADSLKEITVTKINSKYKAASSKPTGSFTTGQEADIMLSGIGFNKSGGALLFNHPGNITSDGQGLILADRNNNRVLIWKEAPTGNTPPDLVLGQKDFNTNNPGTGLDELNWPVGVATDGKRLVVADTENDRILIWTSLPSQNGQKADLEIKDPVRGHGGDKRLKTSWPWAVWTDGEKLAVAATGSQSVLIWKTFPIQSNQPADIVLDLPNYFGTPRTLGSDGTNLVVGDHNAKPADSRQGTFFWKTFPIKNTEPDFFRAGGTLLWGPTVTKNGKLIGISDQIHIWNSFPQSQTEEPDLSIGALPNGSGYDFGGMQAGDGSSLVMIGDRLYVSLSNGNKIVGFKKMPQRKDQKPDFAIGSPDINTNTLLTNYFLTNPQVATDGKSLIAGSTFGGLRLYIWKQIPDEDGAKPDFVYNLNFAPNYIGIIDGKLMAAGDQITAVWNKVPLDGEEPDQIIRGEINPASFAGGGEYIALKRGEFEIAIYRKSDTGLKTPLKIIGRGFVNLPEGALVSWGKLFVADTGNHRVLIWNKVESAIAGLDPDVILGQDSAGGNEPGVTKNGLFRPASLAFDGSYLWVGERKFSNRILRFSVK